MSKDQEAIVNQDPALDTINMKDLGYFQTVRRQIIIVMVTSIVAFLLDIVLDIIRQTALQDDLVCLGNFQFDAKDREADIFMIIYSLCQATPTLIIPYAFYYIPFMQEKTN